MLLHGVFEQILFCLLGTDWTKDVLICFIFHEVSFMGASDVFSFCLVWILCLVRVFCCDSIGLHGDLAYVFLPLWVCCFVNRRDTCGMESRLISDISRLSGFPNSSVNAFVLQVLVPNTLCRIDSLRMCKTWTWFRWLEEQLCLQMLAFWRLRRALLFFRMYWEQLLSLMPRDSLGFS